MSRRRDRHKRLRRLEWVGDHKPTAPGFPMTAWGSLARCWHDATTYIEAGWRCPDGEECCENLPF